MKFFKIILKDKNLDEAMKEVWSRFPSSVVIIILWAICAFTLLHFYSYISAFETYIARVLFSLILSFFVSVWAYLLAENSQFEKKYAHIIPFLFTVLFYSWVNNFESYNTIVFFFLSLVWVLSFVFIAAKTCYFKKKSPAESEYCSYFYSMASVFFMSAIFWGLFTLLGFIGIWTVFTLFDIEQYIGDKIFGDWAILSLLIATPLFWLSQVPHASEWEKYKTSAFFNFLVKFVAIPFVSIYFLILYAYTIKVLLNFSDWPKWEVSWMVIGFSILAYICYIFSYTLAQKNETLQKLRTALPYIVFPQIFMLFYAIYLRINQYDITINRYFVVAFGLWLLSISFYYMISKRKKLIMIPATLTLFSILIAIGPWSVYNLPETRQYKRLLNNLEKANILQGTEIVPLNNPKDIDQKLSGEIYSGIEYVCNFDDCEKIKSLFYLEYERVFRERKYEYAWKFQWLEYEDKPIYPWPSKWEIISGIAEEIWVERYYHSKGTYMPQYLHISLAYEKSFFPLNLADYSKLYQVNAINFIWLGKDALNRWAKVSIANKSITLPDWKVYDLEEVYKKLETKVKIPTQDDFIVQENLIQDPNELIFDLDDARLYIQRISIENPLFSWDTEAFPHYSFEWYLLTK